MTVRLLALAAVTGAVALGATAAQAATVQTLTTSQSAFDPGVKNQGWWSGTIANNDSNDNYIVTAGSERDFFTFDARSACRALGATLRLTRFDQTGPLTFSLWDVATPAPVLNANDGTSQTIYDDLGSGTTFGSFTVAPGSATDVLSFPLNAAGVAAFNAARGGFFSVGGSAAPEGYVYGFSGPPAGGVQALTATCAPATRAECKDGGWRSFGVFRNQGDCVSYVATGGRNGPAGRVQA
jgi:hypothetical protein